MLMTAQSADPPSSFLTVIQDRPKQRVSSTLADVGSFGTCLWRLRCGTSMRRPGRSDKLGLLYHVSVALCRSSRSKNNIQTTEQTDDRIFGLGTDDNQSDEFVIRFRV